MTLSTTLQKSRYMQYACVLILSLFNASNAMGGSWLSPVIPQLTAEDCPLGVKFTDEQVSWLVSSETIGAVVGSILSALLSDKIGRKLILLLAAIPSFISWTVSAFITLPAVLITMKAATGVAMGCVFVVAHIYVGEIAEKDIRGRLAIVQSILSTFGSVFVLGGGPFLSYKVLTLVCSVFPALFFVLFLFMPESPYFLVKIGKIEAARKNLYRLSANDVNSDFIELRLQEIETSVANDLSNEIDLRKLVSNESIWKAFLITFVLKTILILSGVFVLVSYLQTIVESSGSIVSPENSSIIFGVIKIPSVILAAVLVDRIGRRPLLIISSLGSAITLAALGIYFYLQDYVEADVTSISWMPTTCLSLYLILIYFGIYLIPGIAISELHTINMKTMVSSCISIYGSVLSFPVSKFFQPLANKWGVYTLFWIFGAVCFFGSLFGFFVLPETKGKSFIEIQAMLSSSKKCKNSACSENTN